MIPKIAKQLSQFLQLVDTKQIRESICNNVADNKLMSEKLRVFIQDRSHQTKSIAVFVKAIGLVTTVDIYLNYSNF